MIEIVSTRDRAILVNGAKAGRLYIGARSRARHGAPDWFASLSFGDAATLGPFPSRQEAFTAIAEHVRTLMREG